MLPDPTTLPLVTALETPLTAEAFLLGRLAFGLVLGFMGLNHFMDTDAMAGYAQAKSLPAPRASVLVSGGTLLAGGLGIALGVLPALAAGALIVFFVVATPTMHDFWAVPEEQQQDEMTQFLKNAALLGGALVFFGLSGATWPYALGPALF
ncbi:MAG: DoxX family protein [Halobacteriaceae archaeon]